MTVKRLAGCTRCELWRGAKNQVVGRGDYDADVLFIGEAPGRTEDVRGIPFCGPAGRVLNKGILAAGELVGIVPRYYITNLVRCRPPDNRDPLPEEVWACQVHLEQLYIDVNPREVVLLGKVARDLIGKKYPDALCLDHPAYILRQGGTESPVYLKFIRNLSETFRRCK